MAFHQIREMAPCSEWLDSRYYLGASAGKLFPFWREKLIEFFEHRHDTDTFIFHGSERAGKTYAASVFLERFIYELSCFEEIPERFGLDPSSKIMLGFVSVSAQKAKRSGIGKLLRMWDSVPYFQEHCPRNTDSSSSLDIGWLEVVYGSNVGHLISEDFMGIIFDEANFVRAARGDEFETAKTLFLEAQIRAHNTFSIGGNQLGFFGLLSSAENSTSFTEQEIEKAKKDDSAFVVEVAVYEVKPQGFATDKFDLFLGVDDLDPFLLEDVTEDVKAAIGKTYGLTYAQFLNQHESLILHIPVDLKKFYRTDIHYAIKTISGRNVRGSSKFLKNPALLDAAFKGNDLRNPLVGTEIPTLSLLSDDTITDFLDDEILKANYEEGCKLYIHLDLSKSGDKTGFAASYKSETTGKFRTLLNMAVHRREEADEIDLSKVEDVIYHLYDLDMDIGFISHDQYAEVYISQNLKKRFGVHKVARVSADVDDTHYLIYLFLLKRRMVEHYYYAPFERSLKSLDHDRASHKVDHPADAEKDVSDATVVSLSNCFRIEGVTREEVVANQFLAEADDSDKFYDELLAEKDEVGFYDDLLLG